mmetsp:Transcript_30553/g.99789  ORF Transcript_30553/g.99789 Transcript_30553/m.99789 type:complete len:219 (+) Transcript_30553:1383-2039(+)
MTRWRSARFTGPTTGASRSRCCSRGRSCPAITRSTSVALTARAWRSWRRRRMGTTSRTPTFASGAPSPSTVGTCCWWTATRSRGSGWSARERRNLNVPLSRCARTHTSCRGWSRRRTRGVLSPLGTRRIRWRRRVGWFRARRPATFASCWRWTARCCGSWRGCRRRCRRTRTVASSSPTTSAMTPSPCSSPRAATAASWAACSSSASACAARTAPTTT